jgi:DNA-binding Xre family transcriptional regulator
MPTASSSKLLSNLLTARDWQQSDLARASGIDRATVGHHLTGVRDVRDTHLAAYCAALDRHEQVALVAAWLRDTLPADAQSSVLEDGSNRLCEEAVRWRPELDHEQRHMLDWWARQLTTDRETDQIFRAITRKAGWTPAAPMSYYS